MGKMINIYESVLYYMAMYVAIMGNTVNNLKKAISQKAKP